MPPAARAPWDGLEASLAHVLASPVDDGVPAAIVIRPESGLRAACVFVNTGPGKHNRLRGVYARVVRDGHVTVGDRVRKIT